MICGYCQKVILRNLTVKEILFHWLLSDTELCSQCLRQFTPIQKDQACPRCMRSGEQDLCADCQRWQKQYPQRQFFHQALYQYDEAFANWLKEYKFGGDYRLRRTFQQQVRVALKGYRGLSFVRFPYPKVAIKSEASIRPPPFWKPVELKPTRFYDVAVTIHPNPKRIVKNVWPYPNPMCLLVHRSSLLAKRSY